MKITNYFSLMCLILLGFIIPVPSKAYSDIRNVGSFSKIEIAGPFKVQLIQGDVEQVEISADDQVLEKIITKVEGGILRIYHKEKLNVSGKIMVTVSFKEINSLDCSGAIDLKSDASLKFTNLDLDLSGASKIEMNVSCTKLDIDISGAGSVLLNGKAQKVSLDISGSGSMTAASLESDEYEVDISGAGTAKINAATKLNVSISGSGSVAYKGNPKIDRDISGSGSLKKMSE